MELILPVYSSPWTDPLVVTTVIPLKEDAIRSLKLHLAQHSSSEEIWYTDGSLLKGSAGGAAVRVLGNAVCERILVPLGEGQVAEGEIEGLLRATEAALSREADLILVVSDSQAGLKGITSTAPRSGQFRAVRYDQLVRSAMDRLPSLRITNLWTPAHIGTTGNEFADDAAKTATTLRPSPLLPISLTSCRRRIDADILGLWEAEWKRASTGRGLRAIDSSPPSLILRTPYSSSSSRAAISLVSRLRTDFSELNAHRFRCRLSPSPACDACGAAYETRAHFLLHCPAWDRLRPALQLSSYKAGLLGAVDVRSLLNHPKLLKAVSNYIAQTGRFS
ncbi:hypothetical protein C8R47DRAFT_967730 [Mycena vitilis]|nr:hypothetical protein C8R47DRAFT_967730 [Mycena vitilis]